MATPLQASVVTLRYNLHPMVGCSGQPMIAEAVDAQHVETGLVQQMLERQS